MKKLLAALMAFAFVVSGTADADELLDDAATPVSVVATDNTVIDDDEETQEVEEVLEENEIIDNEEEEEFAEEDELLEDNELLADDELAGPMMSRGFFAASSYTYDFLINDATFLRDWSVATNGVADGICSTTQPQFDSSGNPVLDSSGYQLDVSNSRLKCNLRAALEELDADTSWTYYGLQADGETPNLTITVDPNWLATNPSLTAATGVATGTNAKPATLAASTSSITSYDGVTSVNVTVTLPANTTAGLAQNKMMTAETSTNPQGVNTATLALDVFADMPNRFTQITGITTGATTNMNDTGAYFLVTQPVYLDLGYQLSFHPATPTGYQTTALFFLNGPNITLSGLKDCYTSETTIYVGPAADKVTITNSEISTPNNDPERYLVIRGGAGTVTLENHILAGFTGPGGKYGTGIQLTNEGSMVMFDGSWPTNPVDTFNMTNVQYVGTTWGSTAKPSCTSSTQSYSLTPACGSQPFGANYPSGQTVNNLNFTNNTVSQLNQGGNTNSSSGFSNAAIVNLANTTIGSVIIQNNTVQSVTGAATFFNLGNTTVNGSVLIDSTAVIAAPSTIPASPMAPFVGISGTLNGSITITNNTIASTNSNYYGVVLGGPPPTNAIPATINGTLTIANNNISTTAYTIQANSTTFNSGSTLNFTNNQVTATGLGVSLASTTESGAIVIENNNITSTATGTTATNNGTWLTDSDTQNSTGYLSLSNNSITAPVVASITGNKAGVTNISGNQVTTPTFITEASGTISGTLNINSNNITLTGAPATNAKRFGFAGATVTGTLNINNNSITNASPANTSPSAIISLPFSVSPGISNIKFNSFMGLNGVASAGHGHAIDVLASPDTSTGQLYITNNYFQYASAGTATTNNGSAIAFTRGTTNGSTAASNIFIQNNYFDWQSALSAGFPVIQLNTAGIQTISQNVFSAKTPAQTNTTYEENNSTSAGGNFTTGNYTGLVGHYYAPDRTPNTWYPAARTSANVQTPATVAEVGVDQLPLGYVSPLGGLDVDACVVPLEVAPPSDSLDLSEYASSYYPQGTAGAPTYVDVYWTASNSAEVYIGRYPVTGGGNASSSTTGPAGHQVLAVALPTAGDSALSQTYGAGTFATNTPVMVGISGSQSALQVPSSIIVGTGDPLIGQVLTRVGTSSASVTASGLTVSASPGLLASGTDGSSVTVDATFLDGTLIAAGTVLPVGQINPNGTGGPVDPVTGVVSGALRVQTVDPYAGGAPSNSSGMVTSPMPTQPTTGLTQLAASQYSRVANISGLCVAQPTLTKSFNPALTQPGASSLLTFTISNNHKGNATAPWSFTDTLPGTLINSADSDSTLAVVLELDSEGDIDISTDCSLAESFVIEPTAAVFGSSGSPSFTPATLSVSGQLAAGEKSCSITVPVTTDWPDDIDPEYFETLSGYFPIDLTNSIDPTNAAQASGLYPAGPASATLRVEIPELKVDIAPPTLFGSTEGPEATWLITVLNATNMGPNGEFCPNDDYCPDGPLYSDELVAIDGADVTVELGAGLGEVSWNLESCEDDPNYPDYDPDDFELGCIDDSGVWWLPVLMAGQAIQAQITAFVTDTPQLFSSGSAGLSATVTGDISGYPQRDPTAQLPNEAPDNLVLDGYLSDWASDSSNDAPLLAANSFDLTRTASVEADSDRWDQVITPPLAEDIEVATTSDHTAIGGTGVVNYTFYVENLGTTTLLDVTASDALLNDLTCNPVIITDGDDNVIADYTSTVDPSVQPPLVSIGTMPPGSTTTCTGSYTVTDDDFDNSDQAQPEDETEGVWTDTDTEPWAPIPTLAPGPYLHTIFTATGTPAYINEDSSITYVYADGTFTTGNVRSSVSTSAPWAIPLVTADQLGGWLALPNTGYYGPVGADQAGAPFLWLRHAQPPEWLAPLVGAIFLTLAAAYAVQMRRRLLNGEPKSILYR